PPCRSLGLFQLLHPLQTRGLLAERINPTRSVGAILQQRARAAIIVEQLSKLSLHPPDSPANQQCLRLDPPVFIASFIRRCCKVPQDPVDQGQRLLPRKAFPACSRPIQQHLGSEEMLPQKLRVRRKPCRHSRDVGSHAFCSLPFFLQRREDRSVQKLAF